MVSTMRFLKEFQSPDGDSSMLASKASSFLLDPPPAGDGSSFIELRLG